MVSPGCTCMQNGQALRVSTLRGRSALLMTRPRPLTARLQVRAGSDKAESPSDTPAEDGDKGGLKMPAFLKPLTDFGVGKKSVWEGGVGLFILTGIGVGAGLVAWVTGLNLNKGRSYECTVRFPEACSITVGTPLRGIQIGSVLKVQPHLDRVDVALEIDDENTVIPRNSRLFANQSGLIAEPLVDIMPQDPIPEYSASPLAASCGGEGAIVCHKGSIDGEKGVALDDLVYTCTQLMKAMDTAGMETMFNAADVVSKAVADARPLVDATARLVDQVTPLLRELREAGVVEHVDALATLARETAGDVRSLQTTVLDEGNVEELRRSVRTLTKTLTHIESVLGDVAGMSGDSGAHASLRQLIEAFSRLVED